MHKIASKKLLERIPHTRGDEPSSSQGKWCPGFVFPTRVGMNRSCLLCYFVKTRIPHTRGDEPG